jgi:hypothetical protein
MEKYDNFIEGLAQSLPDTCRTKDLINAGLYRSEQAAAAARRRGDCPGYLKVNERVVIYPKADVISFLQSKRVATASMVSAPLARKTFQCHSKVVTQ